MERLLYDSTLIMVIFDINEEYQSSSLVDLI